LIVYRFDAPLVFPNAAFFIRALGSPESANAGVGLKCVILDAEAISDFDSNGGRGAGKTWMRTWNGREAPDLWKRPREWTAARPLDGDGLTTRLGAEHIYPSVRAAGGGVSRAIRCGTLAERPDPGSSWCSPGQGDVERPAGWRCRTSSGGRGSA